jgi:serine/threonine-protein kinase RsbW
MTRILAAGVASRVGFTLDEVDDLRIAIDELCFSLVGAGGRDGTVVVTYHVLDDGLVVEGAGHFTDGKHSEPLLSPLSMQILQAVADECELEAGLDGPTFRLVKRHRDDSR